MSQERLISMLVENRSGVLMRVASMIRRRGFNIDSLSVGRTEDPLVSRMTITVHVGQQAAEQAAKQLSKIVDVITVEDITDEAVVAHQLLLIKLHSPVESRRELLDIVEIFRGRVVDVAQAAIVVEVTGSMEKVDNFITLVKPFGIKELARSGQVAMVRGDQARLELIDNYEDELDEHPHSESIEIASEVGADGTGSV